MSFLIVSIICTSMMIPGLISYTIQYAANKKPRDLSVVLFSVGGVMTGLTRTITVGIALLAVNYPATILWNRAYESSLLLFFPFIPFFLSQIVVAPGSRVITLNMWLSRIGILLAIAFIFLIWFVPESYMIPNPVNQIEHPIRMGRGAYGPANHVAMTLLFLYILYAFVFSIYSRFKIRGRSYLTILNLGLTVSLFIIFLEFYELFAGRYPGPVPQYAFSRLLVALTVFSITAVIAMTQKNSFEAGEVKKDRYLIKKSRDELARVAYIDEMTGLLNRQALFRDVNHSSGKYDVMLMLDVDNLSDVNSLHGYQAGDNLIKSVAAICRVTMPGDSDLYRVNADTFVILLSGATQQAEVIAADLLARVKDVEIVESSDTRQTASIGIAAAESRTDWEGWINRTNTALETAKLSRNRYVTFNPVLHEDEKRRQSIIAGMKTSLARSGFSVVYQPIVTSLGDPVGAEALVRWEHPDLGPVEPDEFIPLAEATGMVSKITLFVIRRVLEDFRNDKGLNDYCRRDNWRININLSVRDLIDQELGSNIDRIFAEFDQDCSMMGFEVTETELISDWQQTRDNLSALKDRGFTISLDDFGTGYSSLSYLNILPLDKLKVDRSFIADIPGERKNITLLDTIIRLGKDLNLDLVIEGIERADQLVFLNSRDCRLYQGYFFAPPLCISDFRSWVDRRKS